MTRLDCSVVNCAYNKEDSCCKDNIHVGGKHAKVTDETCCESFREKKEGMTNSNAIPSKPTEVACEAECCCYNHSCKCGADQIQVSGSNACQCGQTACATFEMK